MGRGTETLSQQTAVSRNEEKPTGERDRSLRLKKSVQALIFLPCLSLSCGISRHLSTISHGCIHSNYGRKKASDPENSIAAARTNHLETPHHTFSRPECIMTCAHR